MKVQKQIRARNFFLCNSVCSKVLSFEANFCFLSPKSWQEDWQLQQLPIGNRSLSRKNEKELSMGRSSSTTVEHTPYDQEVKGLNPARFRTLTYFFNFLLKWSVLKQVTQAVKTFFWWESYKNECLRVLPNCLVVLYMYRTWLKVTQVWTQIKASV